MRRAACLAVCIAATMAVVWMVPAAPLAQPAPIDATRRALPVEGVITNPDWARKPTGNDIARYYPPIAQAVGMEGQSTIHCAVNAEGGLADCTVIAEAPKGLRFGEATLRLANLFKMKPMTVDGSPISGGAINIPVRFSLPQSRAPQAATPDPSKTNVSSKTTALAHRVAFATTELYIATAKASVEQLRKVHAPLSHEEEVALDAFGQAVTGSAPQVTDGLAAAYAKTYSEAELAGIAAFFESSAGHAWISRSRDMGPAV